MKRIQKIETLVNILLMRLLFTIFGGCYIYNYNDGIWYANYKTIKTKTNSKNHSAGKTGIIDMVWSNNKFATKFKSENH